MQQELLYLIVGTILGAIFGFFANVFVMYFQFKHSIAGKRVEWVVCATKDFAAKRATTAEMRNRYRYSLGIIIEDLIQANPDTIKKKDGSWPVLVNYPKEVKEERRDRWQRFDGYVRPVINDINSFAFLGAEPYREFSSKLRQLHSLMGLLTAIEDVVMRIDAAHEVLEITHISIQPLQGIVGDDQKKADNVQEGYNALYAAWQDWLKQCESHEIRWSSSTDDAQDTKDC